MATETKNPIAKDPNAMTKHIAMRIPQALANRVDRLTSESGTTMSGFIREAIVAKVRNEEIALRQLGVNLDDL